MPKSKKRGGEKAHRKRIQKVNKLRTATIMHQQKLFKETLEKMREEYSAQTENNESQSEPTGFVQSTETV
jgi:hypothetical protein